MSASDTAPSDLPMNLTRRAREQPDTAAYVLADTGETLTYADLEARSNRLAHLLRSLGFAPGDHVAVLSINELAPFPFVWAAHRAGLYYTPVNWHLTAGEAAFIVDDSEARLLVHSADLDDLARTCAQGAPRVTRRATFAELEAEAAGFPDTPLPDESEGAPMFYSSGTTGRPKGILPPLVGAPFGTGVAIDHVVGASFGVGVGSVYLSPGPIYHAAPMLWTSATIRNGGTAVVMSRFDPVAALRAVERYGVTHGQFVPTMFVRMLKLPESERTGVDLSSLRVVVHAAAPCPVPVKEAMIDWLGPILVEYYAASETNGMCIIDSAQWLTHKGSVGRAVVGVPHVCDPLGQELPPGEVGVVWFSDGPEFEYHNDPEKTAQAHDARGWSTIGDLGSLDAEGYLYLSDRRTDLIVTGGVNVYPTEVEQALSLHPAVADIAVVGLPDDDLGQRVHAVVKAADPAQAGPELAAELLAHVRAHVASFKAPRTLEFVDDFPRLPTGKVLRRKLVPPAG